MSMSTTVYGIVPPDEKFKQMKKIYDDCKDADIEPPEAVSEFFDWETPDDAGMTVSLDDVESEYSDEYSSGIEIELSKLDPKIKTLRFVNGW